VLGEQIVDRLAEQGLEGGVAVGGEAPGRGAGGPGCGAGPASPRDAWSRIARRRSVERAIAGLGAGRREAGQLADGGPDRGDLLGRPAARIVLGGASPGRGRVVDGGAQPDCSLLVAPASPNPTHGAKLSAVRCPARQHLTERV